MAGAARRRRPGAGGGRELGVAGEPAAAAGLRARPGRAVPRWGRCDRRARVRPDRNGVRRQRFPPARGQEHRGLDRRRHRLRRHRPRSRLDDRAAATRARSGSGGGARRVGGRRRRCSRASATDVCVYATHDPTPGFERDLVVRALDFYRRDHFLRAGDELHRIDVPQDADLDVHREWLLVRNRSAWTVGGTTYPAGCLARRRRRRLDGGGARRRGAVRAGRAHVAAGPLLDAAPPAPDAAGGRRDPDGGADAAGRRLVAGAARRASPAFSSADVVSTDPDTSDEYFLSSSGFLEPPTLRYGVVGDEAGDHQDLAGVLRHRAACEVSQHFATSDDGTRIPYFVVGRPDPSAGPDAAHRLRRLRGVAHAVVQRDHRPGLAGARRHLRRGQHPRRRRVRAAVAPGGAAAQAAASVYEDFAAVARGPGRARGHHARAGWASRAAATAAC